MNRRIILPVLLACDLASAQTITIFSAPSAGTSAGQGTGGFGINPEGVVVGSSARARSRATSTREGRLPDTTVTINE